MAAIAFPVSAQQKADSTTFTFRFVADDDMFYVPWSGNGAELDCLLACLSEHKAVILDGTVPVKVDGYSDSKPTAAENLAVAKIRSNRVKTEMILRGGLTEACFTTHNHTSGSNYVTVCVVVPAGPSEAGLEAERLEAEKRAEQQRAEAERLAAEKQKAEEARKAAEQAEAERLAAEQAERERLAAGQAARPDVSGWYAGLQGGVPFGVSQFSSFGADKTRAGWNVGIHGGYRFNPVLSLEAQAAWGEVNLSARDCCPDYWLGSDGVRYEAAVAGMAGWNYSDVRSCTFTQNYGIQLNVNLLGFFPSTRESRWTLELAPRLAAIGTKSTLCTLEGGNEVLKGDNRWHFGAGGNLQAGYAITRNLNLGIYTGITWLTGAPLDGMPEYLHKANYIWESGIRLGWFFQTQTRKEVRK